MVWDTQRGEAAVLHWLNASSCRSSRTRVKLLIGPMELRVMAASCPHSRLGPNTTARFVLVILFTSLWADTYTVTNQVLMLS